MSFVKKFQQQVQRTAANPVDTARDIATTVMDPRTLATEGMRAIQTLPAQAFEGLKGALSGGIDNPLAKQQAPQATLDTTALDQAIQASQAAPAAQFTVGGITPAEIQAALISDPRLQTESRFLPQQQQLAELLQRTIAGEAGPSPAELMLRAEQDRNLNRQMALAASMSGRALPAAQRQILQQQAVSQQEAARQAAILRAQEQMQARGELADVLGTGRQQDLARQAGLADIARSNQAAEQAARMEAARQAFEGQRATQAADLERQVAQEAAEQRRRELAAQMEAEKLRAQTDIAQSNLSREAQEEASRRQVIGSLLGAGAAVGASAAGGK